jgi:hypothetical protein
MPGNYSLLARVSHGAIDFGTLTVLTNFQPHIVWQQRFRFGKGDGALCPFKRLHLASLSLSQDKHRRGRHDKRPEILMRVNKTDNLMKR